MVQCRCMPYYEAFFSDNWSLLQQATLYRPGPNPTFGNPDFESSVACPHRAALTLPRRKPLDAASVPLSGSPARRAGAYIDMAFFPPEYDRARMLASGVPVGGNTVMARQPRLRHGLISNAYTLELINLPYLFHTSGIPMLKR